VELSEQYVGLFESVGCCKSVPKTVFRERFVVSFVVLDDFREVPREC
jgi:hypothetical protein